MSHPLPFETRPELLNHGMGKIPIDAPCARIGTIVELIGVGQSASVFVGEPESPGSHGVHRGQRVFCCQGTALRESIDNTIMVQHAKWKV